MRPTRFQKPSPRVIRRVDNQEENLVKKLLTAVAEN
jgi:hypothetical protein